MQFTRAEDYGMRGVLYLAERGAGRVTPLSEVSEAESVPEKFLAKIFQSLSKAGIVRSHRGVRGGFTLWRAPAELTVKEVLEAIQGPYHLMNCLHDPDACSKSATCALRELLILAEDRLVATFEEFTVADLLKKGRSRKTSV